MALALFQAVDFHFSSSLTCDISSSSSLRMSSSRKWAVAALPPSTRWTLNPGRPIWWDFCWWRATPVARGVTASEGNSQARRELRALNHRPASPSREAWATRGSACCRPNSRLCIRVRKCAVGMLATSAA